MRATLTLLLVLGLHTTWPGKGAAQMPFNVKTEVFREKDGEAIVFALRLEQPFLAGEFEKIANLRLHALDKNAYLIYPKETKFSQKHAEFYGRLRSQGKVKLRLSYEIVSENLDGSRKIDLRTTDVAVAIPTEPSGPPGIFKEWAQHQNNHFLSLLEYYPDETFFQYCLLLSSRRYGVVPPRLPAMADSAANEANLYDILSNSLAIQQSLQTQSLSGRFSPSDQDIHISELRPPTVVSLDYEKLLELKKTKESKLPRPHEISKLVPADQYFIHFHSMNAAGELFDLANQWGDSLLRILTVQAVDNRVMEKFEDQLCVRRGVLTKLFADGVIEEMVLTGSDPYILEGTDLTLLLRLKQPEIFDQTAAGWLADAKKKYPGLIEREASFSNHKVQSRYTEDRVVSSFVTRHDNVAVFSTSPAAIKKIIGVASGKVPRLYDALDYRYVTTILPPSDDRQSGYLFASEAFIRKLIGPEAKISEKRRVECFNNLVMLNNASMFYRLEHGKSPPSLTELDQQRFADLERIRCPHGGAYSFDTRNDTCICSAHNRIKYLNPNAELPVLKVTRDEKEAYARYRTRYEEFWRTMFDPIAMRITVGPTVKLETCVLPFANGGLYKELQSWVDGKPRSLDTSRHAASSVASLQAVYGKQHIGNLLRMLPGVPEVLKADPTLTDLSWLGDRASFHFCDGSYIIEIDPTRLGLLDVPLVGKIPLSQQAIPVFGLAMATLPSYVSIEVEDRDKAARMLEQLTGNLFLQKGQTLGLPKSVDSYRLPEYKKHIPYVLSFQVYAIKIRLHVALVGNQLVAATRPEVLREVIDAAENPEAKETTPSHLLLRLNRKGLNRLKDDLQLYWEEKARLACHKNTISIYNLLKLYEVPIEEVARLEEAKYGVRPFCPDHGTYSWDTRKDQVMCSVHGNRQESRQNPRLDKKSSFAEFLDSIDELTARLRFQEDALISTVEIVRRPAGKK